MATATILSPSSTFTFQMPLQMVPRGARGSAGPPKRARVSGSRSKPAFTVREMPIVTSPQSSPDNEAPSPCARCLDNINAALRAEEVRRQAAEAKHAQLAWAFQHLSDHVQAQDHKLSALTEEIGVIRGERDDACVARGHEEVARVLAQQAEEQLRKRFKDVQAALKKSHADLQEARLALRNAYAERDELRAKNIDTGKLAQDAQDTLVRMRDERDAALRLSQESDATNAGLRVQQDALRAVIASLGEQLKAEKEARAAFETKLDEERATSKRLSAAVCAGLAQQLESEIELRRSLQAQLDSSLATRLALEANQEKLQTTQKQLKATVQDVQEQLKIRSAAVAALQEEMELLRAREDKALRIWAAAVYDADERLFLLDQLRMEKDTLDAQFEQMRMEKEHANAALRQLRADRLAADIKLQQLLADKEVANAELERLRAKVDKLQARRMGESDVEREAFERMAGRWNARDKLRAQAAASGSVPRAQSTSSHRSSRSSSPPTPPRPQTPLPPPSPPPSATPQAVYEYYWFAISTSAADRVLWRFSFANFPWPLLYDTQGNVALADVVQFFDLDRESDMAKKRQIVRKQLARWHPDKFVQRGTLDFVLEKDRAAVLARQREVALCFTDILERL